MSGGRGYLEGARPQEETGFGAIREHIPIMRNAIVRARRGAPLFLGAAAVLVLLSPRARGTGAEPPEGSDDAIPLDRLLEYARAHGPDMLDAQDDIKMSKARVGSSVSRNLPRISMSNRLNFRHNNPDAYTYYIDIESGEECTDPESPTCLPIPIPVNIEESFTLPTESYSFSLNLTGYQPIFAPRQVLGAIKASRNLGMTRLRAERDEENLVMSLLIDYTTVQRSLEEEHIYRQSLEMARKMERIVATKLETGQATQLDYDQAVVDRMKAEQKLEQLIPERELDAALMAQDAGLEPGVSMQVCVLAGPPDPGDPLDLSDATSVKLLEQKVKVDKAGKTSAFAGYLPTVGAMGGLSFSGSGTNADEMKSDYMFDNWYVGGSLSWTLFDGFGRFHSSRSASVKLRQTRRDLENERAELRLNDEKYAQKLRYLAAQRDLMERSVALAERNATATMERYEAGHATYDMVDMALNKLEQQRLQLLGIIQAQWTLTAYRGIGAGQEKVVVERFLAGQDLERCTEVRAMVEAR